MGRVRAGWLRLRSNWFYIMQLGIAAGASYYIGRHLIGHEQPFFAPMATVIVLSAAGGGRIRRAFELGFGVSLGVGLGDLLINYVGPGTWQIAVGVVISVALAMFLDKGVLAANQAAFSAVLIATILPPGSSGGTERMVDAFLGAGVGIAVMALFPQSPLRNGRREIARILGITSRVLDDVAESLESHDTKMLKAALNQARGSQGHINNMIATAKEGEEVVLTSPLMWRQRRELGSIMRVLNPVDNAMRSTRVLARRAVILTEDNDVVSAAQIELIYELASVAGDLSEVVYNSRDFSFAPELPEIVRRLRVLGAKAGMEVAEGGVLSATMILGQTRSLIVDLLQVCGLSEDSALATLVPTSQTPAVPPEVVDPDDYAD
ncbi:FUSC family protein [Corynebacterium epidermidicanis]|uniref:FUSC family protein n=1 Tax=Corynebacterium epidermidicanis TaxID=1050174 RepID=UPI00064161DF|nr:FUSC family protein [Corynebacterium epidermidicanis]